MTPPVTTEALVEAGCRAVYGKNWDGPADKAPGDAMRKVWRDLVAKAQAPLLAAHQQVTAERDEARKKLLEFGEMYDREDKRIAAEFDTVNASLATANAELARLRAEVADMTEAAASAHAQHVAAEARAEDLCAALALAGERLDKAADFIDATGFALTVRGWADEARAATAREGAPQSVLRHLSVEERLARFNALDPSLRREVAALNREEADRHG